MTTSPSPTAAIPPPPSDDQIDRHRFYGMLSVRQQHLIESIGAQSASMSRVHQRLDDHDQSDKKTQEILITQKSRNNTLLLVGSAVWLVISSVFGVLWDKSSSKIDSYIQQIDVLKTESADAKREITRLSQEIKVAGANARTATSMQADIEKINERLNLGVKK